MNTNLVFYLCPMCFETFESEPANHVHQVIRVDTARLDADSRRPMMDQAGNPTSHAPRWFLAAVAGLRGGATPSTPRDAYAR